MNQSLLIALVVAVAVLTATAFGLKKSLETNGALRQEIVSRDQTIKSQAAQIAQAEAERVRLDAIVQTREAERATNERRSQAGKNAVRLESQKPTDFGRCAAVLVPAVVVQRLRNQDGHGNEGREALPAAVSDGRVRATFYP